MSDATLEMVLSQVTDNNLRHTLQFGIGLHHAGLNDRDRSLVEELFSNNKIQVFVCSSDIPWNIYFFIFIGFTSSFLSVILTIFVVA